MDFFWILIGGLVAYSVILGILGIVADRHHRAGWQRLLDEKAGKR
jgi:hypothetical protein